mgnify:CR=1 FL=1
MLKKGGEILRPCPAPHSDDQLDDMWSSILMEYSHPSRKLLLQRPIFLPAPIISKDSTITFEAINDVLAKSLAYPCENFAMRLKHGNATNGRSAISKTMEQRVEEMRSELMGDIDLIANECPNLRKLLISLFGDFEYLNEQTDVNLWAPFADRLTQLEDFTLHAHKWGHVVCLMNTIKTLPIKKIYLSLNDGGQGNGQGGWGPVRNVIPRLETILELSLIHI